MNAASLLISFGNTWAGNKRTCCLLFITVHLEISKGYCKGSILFTCRIMFSMLLILSVTAINQHGPMQQRASIMTMYCLLICSACRSAGVAFHIEHASDPVQILQRTFLFFSLILRFQDWNDHNVVQCSLLWSLFVFAEAGILCPALSVWLVSCTELKVSVSASVLD